MIGEDNVDVVDVRSRVQGDERQETADWIDWMKGRLDGLDAMNADVAKPATGETSSTRIIRYYTQRPIERWTDEGMSARSIIRLAVSCPALN